MKLEFFTHKHIMNKMDIDFNVFGMSIKCRLEASISIVTPN